MVPPKAVEDMIKEFFDSLPDGLKSFNVEIENHLKRLLTSWLNNLQLITREEFDIQCQVLVKTRLKVHQLEAILATMTTSAKDKD